MQQAAIGGGLELPPLGEERLSRRGGGVDIREIDGKVHLRESHLKAQRRIALDVGGDIGKTRTRGQTPIRVRWTDSWKFPSWSRMMWPWNPTPSMGVPSLFNFATSL